MSVLDCGGGLTQVQLQEQPISLIVDIAKMGVWHTMVAAAAASAENRRQRIG